MVSDSARSSSCLDGWARHIWGVGVEGGGRGRGRENQKLDLSDI